jgi:hypothetical protein
MSNPDRQDKDRPSSDYLYPDWQPQVQAALVELDTQKLRDHIEAAETAISHRLQAIGLNPNHHAERLAISDSVATLRFLRREYLDRPGFDHK